MCRREKGGSQLGLTHAAVSTDLNHSLISVFSHLAQHSSSDDQEGSEGKQQEGEPPRSHKGNHKTSHKGGNPLDEDGELVTNTSTNLFNITARKKQRIINIRLRSHQSLEYL